MNLIRISPSMLMSLIALLSLGNAPGLPSSVVSASAVTPHVTQQLRGARLRRRPETELQAIDQSPVSGCCS